MGLPAGVRPVDPYHQPIVNHIFSRYDKARQIKGKQDAYCTAALAGQWTGLGEFPEDLQWEALVDVLRGRVRVLHSPYFSDQGTMSHLPFLKVQTHCYEAVDLDDLIRVRKFSCRDTDIKPDDGCAIAFQ